MDPARIWTDIRHSRANWITLSRIASSAAMLWFLLDGRNIAVIGPFTVTLVHAAAIVSAYAFLSDFWDGWLARRRGEVTETGKLLDPLADKIFFFASLAGLWDRIDAVPERLIGAYTLGALEIILVAVGILPLIVAIRAMPIGANKFGKMKFIAEGLFLSALFSEKLGFAHISPMNFLFPPFFLLWAAVTCALLSIGGHIIPYFMQKKLR